MKIVLSGGGTGGHFYPIIAVAQQVTAIAGQEKLINVQMFYLSDSPYNERLLFENHLTFEKVDAGKMRRYFSIRNFFDMFKTGLGVTRAILKIYKLYPDIVFGKGGYASFPTLFAARILGIPVVIHESDSVPGKVNLWASKFAKKIAVAFPGVIEHFPKNVQGKITVVGNPIRNELLFPVTTGAHEFFGFQPNIPTILITGGSQGAEKINDTLLSILPDLVERYQIIHQTGKNKITEVTQQADVVLAQNPKKNSYKAFPYLDETATRNAAGIADIVISRGGSGLFEFAQWGTPALLIPIPETISHDQRTNALTYARTGAAIVIEENNLSPHILLSEINRLMDHPEFRAEMKKAAKAFSNPNAANAVARMLVDIALEHESR